MKAMVAALFALCFILLGVNDAEAGSNKKGKGVPTALVPTPIDGECGSNAGTYRESDTAFSGKFCKVGEQSQTSIAFPDQGSSTLWTCLGQKGGKSVVCTASREAKKVVVAPKPLPPEKVCRWRDGPERLQFVAGQSLDLGVLIVPVCNCCGGGIVAVGGVSFSTPSQTLVSSSSEWVCD